MPSIADNFAAVSNRIAAACRRVGRDPSEVTLVAVTKTVTPAEVAELYRLGVRDFGENRVADGVAKVEALGCLDAKWHLIGHLQRNKAAKAVNGGFLRIHSVDSDKLIDVLAQECRKVGATAEILIETNVSGEASKQGVATDDLLLMAMKARSMPHLRLVGLMTMAPLTDNPETTRPVFRRLRELRDDLQSRLQVELPHLSMGMTGDFEVAVEEGATLVRVGTALFR